MRSFERGVQGESLETLIFSVARSYGFTAPPLSLTRKDTADVPDHVDKDTALVATLVGKMGPVTQTTQVWATAKKGGGTAVVFAAASPKISIAQAFVVKAALATAESAGFSEPLVLISSVGDAESRRRYVREMGNFFKKCAKELPDDILERSHKDPDGALKELIETEHPLHGSVPRTIDYLSESSRKIMLETIDLFEKLNINYELESRLPYTPEVNHELTFAVVGKDRKGNLVRVATGGRIENHAKKKEKNAPEFVGINVFVPDQVTLRKSTREPLPACFVVHIGEAAKIKAFTLLDSLWRAHISLGQALLEETIQDQMEKVAESKTKYVAIIGQREALDDTVILKNAATQLQETIPLDKLAGRMSRVRV